MQTHFHHAAVALALVAGAGAAHAQTVITRRILEMTVPRAPVTLPAETVVETPGDVNQTASRDRETVGLSPATAGPSAMPVARRRVVAPAVRPVPAPRHVQTKVQSTRSHVVRAPTTGTTRMTAMRPAVDAPLRRAGTAPATGRVVVAPSL